MTHEEEPLEIILVEAVQVADLQCFFFNRAILISITFITEIHQMVLALVQDGPGNLEVLAQPATF